MLDVNELPADAAARLSSIEVLRERTRTTTSEDSHVQTLEQTIKVRVWDKLRAFELLGRHLEMWNDKIQHDARGVAARSPAPRRALGVAGPCPSRR